MKNVNSYIHIATTNQCTGCSACASICPTKSITMIEDKEGFMQPHIDADTCIKCHKCEKTCPIVSPISIPTDFETQAYAAINKDEAVRMRSSSGGMFYALAKWTIEQDGVVFGARFDENWEVVHDYTETIEGIEPFMRSKYVQSWIGETYKQAKEFLKAGRQVLFVGTPCQIGGLHAYLGKGYENLILVDFVCHGLPSPGVWRDYLKWKVKGDKIVDINFRDKRDGWLYYQCVTTTTTTTTTRESKMDNIFFKGFLNDVYLRPSCYSCSFKLSHRISDITIADFWGIESIDPNMFDDKGTSLMLIHSNRGFHCFKSSIQDSCIIKKYSIEDGIKYNPSMVSSVNIPRRRKTFFMAYSLFGFRMARYYIDRDIILVQIIRKIRKILKLQ